MAENRAVKWLLKNMEHIKAKVLIFNEDTDVDVIGATQDFLNAQWNEFQNLSRTRGKFDDANEESVEKIGMLYAETAQEIFKWERLHKRRNTAHAANNTMDELIHNQSAFLQQMSTGSKREDEVRLPRVNMPAFSGNYLEFPSFRDLFETSIHNNNNISRVHKLQYLKGLLKGEAYALITHLAVTEANYEEAWQKILSRYNKNKHVVNSLLTKFMEQPSVQPNCSKTLRQLSDVSDEVMRGLKVLDEAAQGRDPWLVYLLTNKLDAESKSAWAHETAEVDFPTLDQLLKFMNKRSDALESLDSMHKKRVGTTRRMHSLMTQSKQDGCPLCNGEHYIGRCEKYRELSNEERKQRVVELKLCFNCLASTHQAKVCRSRFNCKICQRKHHITLHGETTPPKNIDVQIKDSPSQETVTFNAGCTVNTTQSESAVSILPTANVLIKNKLGMLEKCRVLLDSGSQSSFVSENCVQRLQLPRQRANVSISGVTSGSVISKGSVELVMQSVHNAAVQVNVKALILNTLPTKLPSCTIQSTDKQKFKNFQLADADYDKPASIDILLGADQFFTVLEGSQRRFNKTILHKTLFGWVVTGLHVKAQNDCTSSYLALNVQLDMDIDGTLRKFWELEETPTTEKRTPKEIKCEEFYVKTHRRQTDGRYVVKLPFDKTELRMGNSQIMATRRFLALERQLYTKPELRMQYIQQMAEYIETGHMTEVVSEQKALSDDKVFYLAHHPVFKLDSDTTKMRIVFDGSSKTSTGVSLNDALLVGPTIQPTLWATLMRFRAHRVAMTADIEKMYRQVVVSQDDTNYQRVLWREESNLKIRQYKLNRVTFGLACSAYLAIRSLQQLANDDAEDTIMPYILSDFYVDDLLTGAQDVESAAKLKNRLTSVLQKGGFRLHKWKSNIPDLCCKMNSESTIELHSDNNIATKVLGLHWHPADDTFTFKVNPEADGPITKRKIISESTRVFDPLGFLSPSIVLLKILFQKLWFQKFDWDDRLPKCFEDSYDRVRGQFKHFENINIKRYTDHYQNISIHGFADASERAYCAVIYSRVVNDKGEIITNFLTSKTKVAPVKSISIPRLELCAAHLLSKLMFTVKENIEPNARYYAWTDSSIVLAWLSTYPANWKTFVANRTSQILDKFPRPHWDHVKSTDNPADHGSRGIHPKELVQLKQWWQGPDWLRQTESLWPSIPVNASNQQIEVDAESNKRKVDTYAFQIIHTDTWLDELFNKISSLKKALRIIAYVKRYTANLKVKAYATGTVEELKAYEIADAKTICVKWSQGQLNEDIINLRRDRKVNANSKLKSLAPFLDGEGILRVGGRLYNADCEYNSKHQIILPFNHIFTERIIWETHQNNLHAGPTLTNNTLRENYWIINGRNKIRPILKNCVVCAKYAHKTSSQMMGNLPAERVKPTNPFTNCGIDFAGPIYLASKKGRGGTNPVKGYLCIFVCLSVKAVHIEAVSDLTAPAFLAALKRFTARRGVPKKIYTDNGSNFVGAKRILHEASELIANVNTNYLVSEYLSENGIEWHFIPPAAPHFGGIWESAVKSVKTHLLKTTNNVNLTYEEMSTLLCQIENILNSRPLTAIPSDDNYEILTPAHFLLGTSTGSVPEAEIKKAESNITRWQRIQLRVQTFWKKYYRDYLNNLQQRRKWNQEKEGIKPNDIVIIKEDNTPVCKWPMGRIIQTHPGNDGLVRVATIKTSSTTLTRPIVKLCKLPIS